MHAVLECLGTHTPVPRSGGFIHRDLRGPPQLIRLRGKTCGPRCGRPGARNLIRFRQDPRAKKSAPSFLAFLLTQHIQQPCSTIVRSTLLISSGSHRALAMLRLRRTRSLPRPAFARLKVGRAPREVQQKLMHEQCSAAESPDLGQEVDADPLHR